MSKYSTLIYGAIGKLLNSLTMFVVIFPLALVYSKLNLGDLMIQLNRNALQIIDVDSIS